VVICINLTFPCKTVCVVSVRECACVCACAVSVRRPACVCCECACACARMLYTFSGWKVVTVDSDG